MFAASFTSFYFEAFQLLPVGKRKSVNAFLKYTTSPIACQDILQQKCVFLHKESSEFVDIVRQLLFAGRFGIILCGKTSDTYR